MYKIRGIRWSQILSKSADVPLSLPWLALRGRNGNVVVFDDCMVKHGKKTAKTHTNALNVDDFFCNYDASTCKDLQTFSYTAEEFDEYYSDSVKQGQVQVLRFNDAWNDKEMEVLLLKWYGGATCMSAKAQADSPTMWLLDSGTFFSHDKAPGCDSARTSCVQIKETYKRPNC